MKKLLIVLSVIIALIAAVLLFIRFYPSFGGMPSKSDRKEYSTRTEYYDGKKFIYPEKWTVESNIEDIRISSKDTSPVDELPVSTPDFSLADENNVMVTWFGHSSVLIQFHGYNLLCDPVFSERCSPMQWIGPKRFSEPTVSVKDLPHLDAVLLSHDHYDHLDQQAVKELNAKSDIFIVPLGVEKHLERWKIPENKISTVTWWDKLNIGNIEINCCPSRHFTGRRLIDSDMTQWCSWVIRDDTYSIFDSGDGGFGGHFQEIHDRFSDFDFALMECGQYNSNWHHSHLFPEESANAADIVKAGTVLPIHWGAFILSNHGWDDCPERFTIQADKLGLNVVTPHLCETFSPDNSANYQNRWWRDFT